MRTQECRTDHKEIAEFRLEDGTTFLIEVEETESASVERAANVDLGQQVVRAKQSFEAAIDQVTPVARAAINKLRQGLSDPADEIELKFGLKMTAAVGAIIASVGGDVNFEVTLKWKQK